MTDRSTVNLHTLPVEIVYRVLDHLTTFNILWSMRNVCTRIDAILDTYKKISGKLFSDFIAIVSRS